MASGDVVFISGLPQTSAVSDVDLMVVERASAPAGQHTSCLLMSDLATYIFTKQYVPPNTLSAGTTTTLAAGSQATVSITGNAPNQLLNIGVPAGFDGQVLKTGTPTNTQFAIWTNSNTIQGTSGSGTLLDQVGGTALTSSTGFLQRTGAATYAYISATNGITAAMQAQMPTLTVKSNLTGGTANEANNTVTAVLDTLGATQGQILFRNASVWVPLNAGAANSLLTSNGAGANPSWVPPVVAKPSPLAYSAQSSNYTVLTTDIGTYFDLTSSATLTLPAAPGTGFYFWVRKRDPATGGVWAITPTTVTIDGLASISVYQEAFQVFWDGTNYRTMYRQRGWIPVSNLALSAVSSITLPTYFADAEVRSMEVDIDGTVVTNTHLDNITLTGATLTNGQSVIASSTTVTTSTTTTAVSVGGSTAAATNPLVLFISVKPNGFDYRNLKASTGGIQFGGSQFTGTPTALVMTASAGTYTTINAAHRVYRP